MDYEKLGLFYMGRDHERDPVLLDSRDLTTHACIVGMTGSGKTGLGIGLLEEAAIDKIPVIAIDPKGDLGNLLLNFPDLKATDFQPWVEPATADKAQETAALWREGLADWGQSPERIQKLRDAVDMAIYTPGSSAGRRLSVLSKFDCPPEAVMHDRDAWQDRIDATVTGLLALLGIESDPVTGAEHILLANILAHRWREGRDLGLADLIRDIQSPPFDSIGVMQLEVFCPDKMRLALAMKLNALLGSPGFADWMQGDALSADSLFFTEQGKPRISVIHLSHLNDEERMFIVCMLLNAVIAWMRSQPGTGSLRAILYMDEVFGYLPPTANPPSKKLFLLLLKQARAFGLGVVLSTQNPIDLDYKALSNTGMWFIGRLQTERDRDRLLDGLAGSADGQFDKQGLGKALAGLNKRQFLLHNVHEDGPQLFDSRWVLSYLAGPMSREQIKRLCADESSNQESPTGAGASRRTTNTQTSRASKQSTSLPPKLHADIPQYFFPADGADNLQYRPVILAAAEVGYFNQKYGVNEERSWFGAVDCDDQLISPDWSQADDYGWSMDDLLNEAEEGAGYDGVPKIAALKGSYRKWTVSLKRHLRTDGALQLLRSPSLKVVSTPGESQRDFRIRLATIGSEERDKKLDALRKRYGRKQQVLSDRLLRAEQAIEREQEQAKRQKMDTALGFGSALLSGLFGTKKLSAGNVRRASSAMRRAGKIGKEVNDVRRAEARHAELMQQMADLEAQLQAEVDELEFATTADAEELETVTVRPKSTDIHLHFVGLGWLPE